MYKNKDQKFSTKIKPEIGLYDEIKISTETKHRD